MRVERRVIAVMMILTMWFSFASCDDELVEDPSNPGVEEPIDDGNDGDGDNGGGDDGGDDGTPSEPHDGPIMENEVFTTTLILDGEAHDNLLIRNCTFENMSEDQLAAIFIKTVNNVTIKDCIFRNLRTHAVLMQGGQTSDNVIVEDNEMYDVDGVGVASNGDNHINTIVRNNIMHEVAIKDKSGSTPHAIYLCGKEFLIEGNQIYNCGSADNKGLGISVRSCGSIIGNKIYNGRASGIGFSSDHPGFNGTLLIENNVIYDNYKNAITLSMSNTESPLGEVIVRFNTMLSGSNPVIYANSWKTPDSKMEAYGNILIRTDGNSQYIDASTSNPFTETLNIQNAGDVGFANFASRDFHLKDNSEAVNYAIGVEDYPSTDIEDTSRSAENLDAGAYEKN
jgi:hypothetical protein